MGIVKEFKEFVIKGNVLDMAVGIIIGVAFGKIITSLVNDILMPPIGLLLGNVDFRNLAITLQNGTDKTNEVLINYGVFINTIVDFIIVAFVIFILLKIVNKIIAKKEKPHEVPTTPKEEVLLLTEIRDLLKIK